MKHIVMKHIVKKRTHQSYRRVLLGFTLVELLVAMALGLMLTSGIVSIYLQSRRNYMQDDELSRLQENVRYSINLLKRELTMTGFIGSLADYTGVVPVAIGSDCTAAGNWALNPTLPFEMVSDVAGAPLVTSSGTTLTCISAADVQPGTDIVSIKRTADKYTLKNGVLNVGVTEDDEQWYLRAVDHRSSLGFIFLGAGGSINAVDKTPGSLVDYWEYYNKIFFIRNYSNVAGDGIPTLCVAALEGAGITTECLIEGIEDLQVEVGVDSNEDSTPNFFTDAPTSGDIENIVALRVHLLARSVRPLGGYTNEKTYQLGEKSVAAFNDGYVRKVFSTTIQMRNAILPDA